MLVIELIDFKFWKFNKVTFTSIIVIKIIIIDKLLYSSGNTVICTDWKLTHYPKWEYTKKLDEENIITEKL